MEAGCYSAPAQDLVLLRAGPVSPIYTIRLNRSRADYLAEAVTSLNVGIEATITLWTEVPPQTRLIKPIPPRDSCEMDAEAFKQLE